MEFRAKRVLELKLLLDLATDDNIRAIRLKKLADFLELEAPIHGALELEATYHYSQSMARFKVVP